SVVRGEPTPEQLAALIAVVTARATVGRADPTPAVRSPWVCPVLRSPLAHGPGAWRGSCLPR
ncbi:MAG: acyl-CoA carboxylase subunit epsilon, partial [Frankiales bacterium]|nr:acyl-CoA carboxylase subunit epsilon [Frankiales bacterium]